MSAKNHPMLEVTPELREAMKLLCAHATVEAAQIKLALDMGNFTGPGELGRSMLHHTYATLTNAVRIVDRNMIAVAREAALTNPNTKNRHVIRARAVADELIAKLTRR